MILLFSILVALPAGGATVFASRPLPAAEFFQLADKNGDGLLDFREYEEQSWKDIVVRADNKGRLSKVQFAGPTCASNVTCLRSITPFSKSIDLNGDGFLGRDELGVVSRRLFDKLDVNHDDVLTRKEFLNSSP